MRGTERKTRKTDADGFQASSTVCSSRYPMHATTLVGADLVVASFVNRTALHARDRGCTGLPARRWTTQV
jgi:hypothetical protein